MGDRAVDADYELACQRPEVSSAMSLLCDPAVSLYRAVVARQSHFCHFTPA
jgi:hypothetical protein